MTLDEYINTLRGKRIAVLGIGVSNTPLIELLLQGGCDVTACDKRDRTALGEPAAELERQGAKLRLGPGYLDRLEHDVIFRTPGLHPFTPQLVDAKKRGSLLTSEMEVFFSLCPCKTICVTGSDGKTTTTTLISELLRHEGHIVHLGGNIGRPLLLDLPKMSPGDFAVLELSSFQLHSMSCRPDTAVITNVSPNHLDVHPSYEDYTEAKSMIFRRHTAENRLVLNLDDPHSGDYAAAAKSDILYFSKSEAVDNGYFLRGGKIYRAENGKVEPLLDERAILLPGLHNRDNYMAAFAAVDGLVEKETCRAVAGSFAGVAHRLELVRKLRGVTYFNDSIATSPTRTIAGLRSFDKKPVLIAGGYDKHIPFDGLGDEICRRVKALILTGDTAGLIKKAVTSSALYDPQALPITEADGFEAAVLAAHKAAKDGDVVLLSPACASFDRFENFAKRGEAFREIVLGLE